MRRSVVRRGTSYYVKIELDPDAVTGKRRQKWLSGYRTKRDAERARIDLVQERLSRSTIAITLGIYSHVAPTLHDEAAELVADLIM